MLWWSRSEPPCLLRRVIVNQVSDPNVSIRGVLWQSRGEWLTLQKAELLATGRDPEPIPTGEVVIHRDQIAFMQVYP